MSIEDAIARMDTLAGKLERLGKLLLWSLLLIISGAVWAARIEWRTGATADELRDLKPLVSQHERSISNIEGRLHGIASQVGRVPSRVAEKLGGNGIPPSDNTTQ